MPTLFTKIKTKVKRILRTHMNPHRFWVLVLRTFFIICVVLIAGNFYLLYQIKTEQIFQIKKSSASSNVINASLLQNVKGSLDQKAQTQAIIKENPPMYSDPSM